MPASKTLSERRLQQTVESKMTGLDRWIGSISPGWAFKRLQYRMANEVMLSSPYRSGDKNRLRKDWNPLGGSADEDLLPQRQDLVNDSRDLNRNNAWARSVTNTVTVNTIGPGIKAQSKVIGRELEGVEQPRIDKWQTATEKKWRKWCPGADARGRLSFNQMQQVIFRAVLESGEVLVLPVQKPVGPRREIGLAFELIEADRLASPNDLSGRLKEHTRQGIEMDSSGEPIAYWIRKTHPGDRLFRNNLTSSSRDQFIRYPAFNSLGQKNIFHLFWQHRPDQSRGEPFFAPILSRFQQLGDYMLAEVVAARIGACFAAFITKTDPRAGIDQFTKKTNSKGERLQTIQPGMINHLAAGESVSFANPTRPGGTFSAFVEVLLREIGAASGLPYELVAKDFSKVNYSSARAAMLEARKFFRVYQEWMTESFLQPVWEMVMFEHWLRNMIPNEDILGEDGSEWLRALWVPPPQGFVDPVKEVQASIDRIENNLSTHQKEAALQGDDWEEIFEQRGKEKVKAQAEGLLAGGSEGNGSNDAARGPATPPVDPSTQTDPSETGEDEPEDTGEEPTENEDAIPSESEEPVGAEA